MGFVSCFNNEKGGNSEYSRNEKYSSNEDIVVTMEYSSDVVVIYQRG